MATRWHHGSPYASHEMDFKGGTVRAVGRDGDTGGLREVTNSFPLSDCFQLHGSWQELRITGGARDWTPLQQVQSQPSPLILQQRYLGSCTPESGFSFFLSPTLTFHSCHWLHNSGQIAASSVVWGATAKMGSGENSLNPKEDHTDERRWNPGKDVRHRLK